MEHGRWPGTWKTVCDVCGFWYPSDQVRKRWDGLITCKEDWEQKHPQLSIRIPKEEIGVPFSRPEPEDVFVDVCTIVTSSAYAGLGTAGCMLAGNTAYPLAFLLQLNNGVYNS